MSVNINDYMYKLKDYYEYKKKQEERKRNRKADCCIIMSKIIKEQVLRLKEQGYSDEDVINIINRIYNEEVQQLVDKRVNKLLHESYMRKAKIMRELLFSDQSEKVGDI